jgi:uncharacterized Zn finger protein (UPF0148 family)
MNMVPEISHRCPSCGASTHDFGEGVLFCPECGKPLAGSEKAQGGETGQPAAQESVATASVSSSPAADSDKPATVSTPTVEKAPGRARDERTTARERTRETLQRASQRTRGAIEDNVKRVEKIHHVSTVVLEEATYDPSLRFVLVALGLFVLFIVLLVLSKVMG